MAAITQCSMGQFTQSGKDICSYKRTHIAAVPGKPPTVSAEFWVVESSGWVYNWLRKSGWTAVNQEERKSQLGWRSRWTLQLKLGTYFKIFYPTDDSQPAQNSASVRGLTSAAVVQTFLIFWANSGCKQVVCTDRLQTCWQQPIKKT